MNRIADWLRLLADDTRLRILHLLHQEPLTVAELQDILGLGQSSVSGHLGKLKRADIIHDVAEGAARRYRLRDDWPKAWTTAWSTVSELSKTDAEIIGDHRRLEELRAARGQSWVERMAGSLDREYAPGRTWNTLAHGILQLIDIGVVLDVGAGDGAMINLFAPRSQQLICVDPSPHMITAGESRIRDGGFSNVRYLEGQAESLPIDANSCDVVPFIQSLQYISDPAAALREAERVLAPGGIMLGLTLHAHDHQEAIRYGHKHMGFRPGQIAEWSSHFEQYTCYELPAETRPPRFQSLVFSGRKPKSSAN